MRYAQAVVSGEIDVCKWVRLACQRHINDLERPQGDDFEFRFDGALAGTRICRFIELLPHVKGKWAGRKERIGLEDWQCFFLCVVFGWVHKVTGLRRFRRVYLEVPRKNSKSTTAAGIGLYGFAADGHYAESGEWVPEFAPEVYSGATTEYQALEVFRPAWQMAAGTSEFREQFSVELGGTWKNPQAIFSNTTLARFHPLVGKPGDGASPSMAIVDEYHEHASSALLDAMQTGMGAREQPLLLVITTAGGSLSSPCYALRRYVQQVLEGVLQDERIFGAIYTLDEGDDWTTEAALRKCNPNFGVSVERDNLLADLQEAINDASKQNSFKTKHENVWVSSLSAWMNMEWWHRQADTTLSPEQFAGEDGAIAVDLSSKLDLTSKLVGFTRQLPDGPRGKLRRHVYVFGSHYLPSETASDPAKQHYQTWAKQGKLTVTDGAVIDYDRIEIDVAGPDAETLAAARRQVAAEGTEDAAAALARLEAQQASSDSQRHNILLLGYDPWGATQFAQRLQKRGVPIVEIPQNVQQLSDAMKSTEALVKAGCLHHTGDEVLTFGVSNIVARVDANENVFPRKETSAAKIDPGVALIMLVKLLTSQEAPAKSIYEQHAASEWSAPAEDSAEASSSPAPPAKRSVTSIYDQFKPEDWRR